MMDDHSIVPCEAASLATLRFIKTILRDCNSDPTLKKLKCKDNGVSISTQLDNHKANADSENKNSQSNRELII